MRSLTLQTGNTIVTSGNELGKISFAASAESDGSTAITVGARVIAQAEGAFQSTTNPTSLVFATAAANAAASGKIKISDNGHILPMANNTYDIGDQNLRFRNIFATSGSFSGSGALDVANAIQLLPSGTTAGDTSHLRFYELAANGTNYVGFKAPNSINSNLVWTLPSGDGSANQVLQTNGVGVLNWTTPSAGGGGATIANSGDNRVLTSDGSTSGIVAESNLTFNGTKLSVTGDITVDNLTLDLNTIVSSSGNLVIAPAANGALVASTTGNARGANAVDLQTSRSAATQVSSGQCSTVSGGSNNTASSNYSTVSGGFCNTASGECSTVGGGHCNTASGNYSTISGGYCNTASSSYSTVGGGGANTASGADSTVSGGLSNIACCSSSTVSGGRCNTASGINATVSGGYCNVTNARHSRIGGGYRNIIQSPTNECCSRGATIGGGVGHNTSGGTLDANTGDLTGAISCCNAGCFSTIGGGLRNCSTGICSTISGGYFNTASGSRTTIGGGACHCATGNVATIGGGFRNTANGSHATIGGGYIHTSSGTYSTISGGYCNVASGCRSSVSGGQFNTTSGSFSSVGGGCCNITNARHSRIGGGHRNIIQSPTNECCSRGATIGGGVGHNTSGGTLDANTGDLTGAITCCNAGAFSTISGGLRNCVTGAYSTVSGGSNNTASGNGSTVSGGRLNTASGAYSIVGGGYINTASATYSTVAGGRCNTASGYNSVVVNGFRNIASFNFSTISGGADNTNSGKYSFIGGGRNNTASGYYVFISGGSHAKTTRFGETSHAAGRFAANGDAQHTVLIARRNTTDATAKVLLFLNGSDARLTIPASTAWTFSIKLSAYNNTDNQAAWWIFRGGIRRNAANKTALVGSLIVENDSESTLSTASATVVADDTNGALEIQVTGVAAKDIRWVAVADISQVSWGTP